MNAASIFYNIGIILTDKGDNAEGLKYNESALTIYEKLIGK